MIYMLATRQAVGEFGKPAPCRFMAILFEATRPQVDLRPWIGALLARSGGRKVATESPGRRRQVLPRLRCLACVAIDFHSA